MYTGVAELLHKRYAELVRRVESKEAFPNGETFSEPAAAIDSQIGEENPQK
jgi:hypothetical protein